MLTSIFSAGNTYTYAAVRTLYGLALEGRAPRFLAHCNRKGVPIYSFCVVMIFPLLSFLQCSSSSSIVITWFVNLVTAGGMLHLIYIMKWDSQLTLPTRSYRLHRHVHHVHFLPPGM
jgi:amino acid transporter